MITGAGVSEQRGGITLNCQSETDSKTGRFVGHSDFADFEATSKVGDTAFQLPSFGTIFGGSWGGPHERDFRKGFLVWYLGTSVFLGRFHESTRFGI